MKKTACLFIILLLICQNASSKTYNTFKRGYWSAPSTWKNNDAPSFISSDTIIVAHYINFDRDIFLNSGAFLRIDSMGGLCGHFDITVYNNAMIYKYGMLQLDSMRVTGGKVILDAPKDAIFTESAIIKDAGASLYVKGAKLMVGPWFQCSGGEYISSVHHQALKDSKAIYPNPNNGKFTVNLVSHDVSNTFKLTDMNGREILVKDIMGNGGDIDISTLCGGIYYWQIISGNEIIDKGKISLLH
jgi:hypothetical protein